MTIRTIALPLLGFTLLLVAGCSVETDNDSDDPTVATHSELGTEPEASQPEENVAIAASSSLSEITRDRTEYETIRVMQLAEGLENPWAVAFLPDGRLLITERPGRLLLWDDGNIQAISGLPEISAQGQGGLLDVVVHPDFAENGWVYFTYSKPNGSGNTATALGRGRLEDTALADVEDLFIQNRYSGPGRHYGSRLAWRADGTLMMSIGDRGSEPPRAQDQGDHAGSVLRLNDDGSVPPDNPFVNDPNVLDEIYTYGNRNIQGLVVDPNSDTVWATNHGPRGGDEIQRLSAGSNYGWPLVTRGLDYGSEGPFPDAITRRMDGIEAPFYEFLPTHAPSGLALITPGPFPAWQGNLLAGGLRSERIRRVVFDDNEVLHEEELLLGTVGRIRDVRQGPDGLIYVLSDATNGGLYRIEPAN